MVFEGDKNWLSRRKRTKGKYMSWQGTKKKSKGGRRDAKQGKRKKSHGSRVIFRMSTKRDT